MTDYKEFAEQMRENAVKNEQGNIVCSPELWEEIASVIEKAIIPPCKVGQTVWILFSIEKTIESREIESIMRRQKSWTMRFTNGDCFTVWDNAEDEYFGKTVFLTKEEAEAELQKEREG